MSKQDILYVILGATVGSIVTFFAKRLYRKIRSGKWDKWLEKEEKKVLLEALRELIENKGEENEKTKELEGTKRKNNRAKNS